MIRLDSATKAPAFEQVVLAVVEAIRRGDYLPGDQLPTVRQLAADLGLAPNTVAKSYKRLEELGHVRTDGRHGTRVSAGAATPEEDALRVAIVDVVRASRAAGVGLDETLTRVRDCWS